MTTFADRETSRSLGAPFVLYLFTYGPNPGDVEAYTTGEDAVVIDDVTFLPVAAYNQDFTATGSLDRAALQVSLPMNLPIVQMFTPWPPTAVVLLKILIGHVGVADYKTTWAGRVLGVQTGTDKGTDNQDAAVFTCEPIATSMRRAGLRQNYQYSCPHALYGPLCKANQTDATVTATVQTNDNPFIELPEDWNGAFDTGLFPNGLATWIDANGIPQLRSIVRVTGITEIQLSGDCSSLLAGMSVALAIGCDHLMTGCNVHNNILNYGGQPWIPTQNPIGITDNFV